MAASGNGRSYIPHMCLALLVLPAVAECMVWEWTRYQNKAILGYNIVIKVSMSLDDCIWLCETTLDPCCRSFEFKPDGRCYLNSISSDDVMLTSTSSHDYYERTPPICTDPSTVTAPTTSSPVTTTSPQTTTNPSPVTTTSTQTTTTSPPATTIPPQTTTTSLQTTTTSPQATTTSSKTTTTTLLATTTSPQPTPTSPQTTVTSQHTTTVLNLTTINSPQSTPTASHTTTTRQYGSTDDSGVVTRVTERPKRPALPTRNIRVMTIQETDKLDEVITKGITTVSILATTCFIAAIVISDVHRIYEDFRRYSPCYGK